MVGRAAVRLRWIAALCVVVVVAGCSLHPSRVVPSQWGRKTVFEAPRAFDVHASGTVVRGCILLVLDEMDLAIRWMETTNVDGEYVFLSARQQKMKIVYQAVLPNKTRVEVHSATEEQTLPDLLQAAIIERAGDRSSECLERLEQPVIPAAAVERSDEAPERPESPEPGPAKPARWWW